MDVMRKFPVQDLSQNEEEVIDLMQLLRAIWHQKIWVVGAILLAAGIGAYYAYFIATPKYRATSVVLLESAGQDLIDLGAVLPTLSTDSEAINTEVEILKSRRLIERLVVREALVQDPEFNSRLQELSFGSRIIRSAKNVFSPPAVPEVNSAAADDRDLTRAVNAFLARLSVRNQPGTFVLKITVTTEGAAKSARLADALAEEYILNQMDVKYEATREATAWLSSRVADLKLELETAEARLAAFSSTTDVISPESVRSIEVQLKELRDRLGSSEATAVLAQDKLQLLESLVDKTAESKAAEAGDIRLKNLLATEGPGEIFDARFDQLLSNAGASKIRLDRQTASLTASVSKLENELAAQSDELVQLQQLARDTEANRLLYEYFLSRLKEASAQEGIQQADARILSNAVLPFVPSEPKKSLILAISATLGAILGVGFVLAREGRQDTYRDAKDLEVETGVPLLGQIPLIPARSRGDSIQYLVDKPTSAVAEAIRNLRTSVLMSRPAKTPQIIINTSSVPSEGKTTMSFALAHSLNGLGKKVLLIEGDMRRLVFDQYLEFERSNGIASILRGNASFDKCVAQDPRTGIDVLGSELGTQNAADLLSSPAFSEFLDDMRARYDFVVIDTPPVLVVPDTRVIAQHADMILFTVHWDQTNKSQVQSALRSFETVNQHIDGLILNRINPKRAQKYGSQSTYGAYGNFGSAYFSE